MMNISVGDVVMLKSGGPKLTVKSVNEFTESSVVFCQYFYDGILKDVSIRGELLEIIPQNKKIEDPCEDDWFND